jgi:prepilin-type N-terminal cleavage/methylation domain-containing protein
MVKQAEGRTLTMKKQGRMGFTLVELMVVAIIVAILAAVAIPLMTANKKRPMVTEAESALGSIRSNMRALLVQTGAYNKDLNGATVSAGMMVTNIAGIGISGKDLEGTYWQPDCYKLEAVAADTFTLLANSSTNPALNGVEVRLTDKGLFSYIGLN